MTIRKSVWSCVYGPRRHHRRVRVHRRRAAAAVAAQHPDFEVVVRHRRHAGRRAAPPTLYPAWRRAYPDLRVRGVRRRARAAASTSCSSACRTRRRMALAPQLVGQRRLRRRPVGGVPAEGRRRCTRRGTGSSTTSPSCSPRPSTACPSCTATSCKGARLVATPGCYVTAATLALRAARRGRADRDHRRDRRRRHRVSPAPAASADYGYSFCTVDEDFTAYGLLDHRHTPEIEQEIGAQVLFTPHLAPMNRGILATCYARPAAGAELSTASLLDAAARSATRGEPFVVVDRRLAVDQGDARHRTRSTSPPASTSAPAPSWRSARIDNLAKGAVGGAVQAANVALGLAETAGLPARRGGAVSDRRRRRRRPRCSSRRCRTSGASPARSWSSSTAATRSPARREHDALALFAEDIVLMRLVGMRPVVVHGGGPQISDLMSRLGKMTEFRNGLRVTDAETVDIARMVLIGQVNPQLVAAINVHGPYAVGVSGEDAGLIRATRPRPRARLRRRRRGDQPGDPRTACSTTSSSRSSPRSAPTTTGQAYNINADTVAGAIAEALGAEKLVYLTDIEGLRRDVDDPASLIRQTTADELDALDRRRHDRRRDDPQGRQLRARRAQRRRAAPTSSTGASPTCCCSRSSPTTASAPWSRASR